MRAVPIQPGRSYLVKYQGSSHVLLAPNGAAAICALIQGI